jgi:C4-dicarboxylate-binding protein DctP
LLTLLFAICAAQAAAATPTVFRISTENSASHFQTRVVQRFANDLALRTEGRLKVEYRHSAQLFRDQDVVRALSEGEVDMAVPGNWQLDRYDPYISLLMFPMFMGRSSEEHHQLRDGKFGQRIAMHLAESLHVVVPGRWLDLGYAHVFTTRQALSATSDVAGMRIRIAGGTAIAAQVAAVGAIPTIIPWPDLPNVLKQGRVDGLISTYESIASARLWEMGIAHAVETKAYFAQYVPIISTSFWDSIPPDIQRAIGASWESVVESARSDAQAAQQAARQTLQAHGIQITRLPAADLKAWRKLAMQEQANLARKMGIPDTLVEEARMQIPSDP